MVGSRQRGGKRGDQAPEHPRAFTIYEVRSGSMNLREPEQVAHIAGIADLRSA